MTTNSRQTLDLLRRELAFVNSGGYRRSLHAPWRAAYLFEESPSCSNFSDRARPYDCSDCWLMQFVPAELHSEQVPCRFVKLGANGITVDSLYRCETLAESEEVLRHWLQGRIVELESQVKAVDRFLLSAGPHPKLLSH